MSTCHSRRGCDGSATGAAHSGTCHVRVCGIAMQGLFVLVAACFAVNQGCPGRPLPEPEAPIVRLELVASGMTSPLGMAVPRDGSSRLFIVDQIGLIRILDGQGNLLPEPFLDLSDRMIPIGIDFGNGIVYDERGLLGMAFHPDYPTNGRFFVFYNAPRSQNDTDEIDSRVRISEFRVSADDPDRADPTSERIVLSVAKPQFNHNGGQLAFGPDGYLYIGIGDGGGANDSGPGHTPELGNGQDLTTLLGKILRIDVDEADPYGIPPDNPFVNDMEARSEIWAYGFRNPWRFSFDGEGERELFVGDVGQNLYEEVDIVSKGGNYGWARREGTRCFDPENPGTPPGVCENTGPSGEPLVDPIIEYSHVDVQGKEIGIAVLGGYVYRGSTVPDLQGHYVFGDFSTAFTTGDGTLFVGRKRDDGTWRHDELRISTSASGRVNRFILGFGEDEEGEIYVLTSRSLGPLGTTGEVYRVTASAAE